MRWNWYFRNLLFFGVTIGIVACTNPTVNPAETTAAPHVTAISPKINSQENGNTPAPDIFATPTTQKPDVLIIPSPTQSTELQVNSNEMPAYNFDVFFDYPQKRLIVKQKTTFLVPAADLEAIPFIVYPALIQNVFDLEAVRINGLSPGNVTLENGVLWVFPESTLNPGEHAQISMDYILTLPLRAAKLGYTFRQANLGDWYPMLPIYDGKKGWLVYPASSIGENLVYSRANFSVVIKIDQKPASLQMVASSPAKIENDTYSFELENGRNFSWSVSPEYEQISVMVGSTEIHSYYFPEHTSEGGVVLDAATRAYAIYSQFLGNLDQQSLSIVEADFRDGMEYQGLFFLGKEYYAEYVGSPQSYLVTLSAHETAHQWFYAEVANNQPEEPWLDEAICTYLELLFYENEYPELTDWWWFYRVNRFNPEGWVNSTIYDHQSFRSYVDAVYLRGALYFDDLRSLLGQQEFEELLRNYFIINQGGLATADDFFMNLPDEQRESLDNLFSVYFQAR